VQKSTVTRKIVVVHMDSEVAEPVQGVTTSTLSRLSVVIPNVEPRVGSFVRSKAVEHYMAYEISCSIGQNTSEGTRPGVIEGTAKPGNQGTQKEQIADGRNTDGRDVQWSVWRRYRECFQLRLSLIKIRRSVSVLKFPVRRVFTSTSPSTILERKQGWGEFLSNVCKICHSPEEMALLDAFLRCSENIATAIPMRSRAARSPSSKSQFKGCRSHSNSPCHQTLFCSSPKTSHIMTHLSICENDCLPRLLGTLCLALSFKKRQQLYDLLISVLSQAIVMHHDQPAEKEVLLKRKAEEEALAVEQAEDEALSRQKAEEVWAKVCAQYLARKQSAEATTPKQTSIASPTTTHVDGELLETEISFVESELQALEHALQAWLLLPHCEKVQRCTHARTQRAEDLQSSARFPSSTKAEEDGKKAEEDVLLKRKVEEEELARSRQVWEQAKEEALARKKSEEEGKSGGGDRRTAQSSRDSASGDVSCFKHVHEKQNIKTRLFSCLKIHTHKQTCRP
jgi:hypothetical protein